MYCIYTILFYTDKMNKKTLNKYSRKKKKKTFNQYHPFPFQISISPVPEIQSKPISQNQQNLQNQKLKYSTIYTQTHLSSTIYNIC